MTETHHPSAAAIGTASGWHTWFFVCIGGLVVFIPSTLVMYGPWSPRRAARDLRRHAEEVEAVLRARGAAVAAGAATAPVTGNLSQGAGGATAG